MTCCGKGRQAINMVKTGAQVIGKIAAGRWAPPQTIEYRRQQCSSCSLRTIVLTVEFCGKPYNGRITHTETEGCGCMIRMKTALADEKCPLGKW